MEYFIQSNTDISNSENQSWNHFANLSIQQLIDRWGTPQGKGIINNLTNNRLSRESLEKNIGKFNGHYDLRGITLKGHDFSGMDLSNIDFFSSNLSQNNFKSANLSNSYLSKCNIKGSSFEWAKLSGALLDNVEFDRKTNFLGVDLNQINFTLATLLYDLALSQQRIQQLEHYYPVFSKILWLTCDYGRSLTRYMLWVCVFIIFYAFAYWYFGNRPFMDWLYFSVVTFATVGYGDIVPIGTIGRVLAISEILVGYLMGGLLIAIFAKRVIG